MSTPPTTRFARTGPDPELLPRVDETPEQYLERLKSLHARLTSLIDAIENRRPALRPDVGGPDRRTAPQAERRTGDDRRAGLPDPRPVTIDRRVPPPPPGPVDAPPRMRTDRGTALIWTVQVAIWIAVVAFALIYGLGR